VSISSFLRVNGLRLAYAEWPGERGPIICLPHLTGHKGSFTSLAERLAPDYRVLALDLRGRGDSDKPDDGYGFAYHARDILAFADALGIERFALIGHSFGATTATYLASIRPERVSALVLLDGGADPTDELLKAMYPTIRRLGRVYPSLADWLDAQRALPFHQPWSAAFERYFIEEAETLPDGSVRSKSSAAAIERDMDQHFLYCMCLHYPNLRCPVLFLRPENGLLGDKGHVFSNSVAANIVRHIPNCWRVDVPGVHHYTILVHDDPPIVQPIREFLEETLVEENREREM
jgi:pimeloyl-ACP methyl ester carboxylesterase